MKESLLLPSSLIPHPSSLIDTHAHLDDERFHEDLPAVLQRAAAAGVGRIVTIATTAASSAASVALAAQHPSLHASVGIHPNHAAEAEPSAWDNVLRLATQEKVVAVGETGLDRFRNYTPFPQQEDYFARHLELARRHNLAVVIHCRQAESDILRMLREDYERHGPVRAVMHSFTGALPTAEACLAMGLYVSFAGMVTYKNAQAVRDVAVKGPTGSAAAGDGQPLSGPGAAARTTQRAGPRGSHGGLSGGGARRGVGSDRGSDDQECTGAVRHQYVDWQALAHVLAVIRLSSIDG